MPISLRRRLCLAPRPAAAPRLMPTGRPLGYICACRRIRGRRRFCPHIRGQELVRRPLPVTGHAMTLAAIACRRYAGDASSCSATRRWTVSLATGLMHRRGIRRRRRCAARPHASDDDARRALRRRRLARRLNAVPLVPATSHRSFRVTSATGLVGSAFYYPISARD